MANIVETISYDAGVYLIATTDPVQGGTGGIANLAAANLANRTAYLKQHVDNLENGTTIPSTVAPKNSPVFTGDPQAPTPALGDNDTSLATTAFVQGTIGGVLNKSVAGAANVTLTAVEAGYGLLNFTGALTANISVIVPVSPTRQWTVMNNTTGAFTLTMKTASGAGVAIAQGKNVELFTEGANVVLSTSDFSSAAMAASTTGFTQAQFDNSTKLATTAFVQRMGGSMAATVLLSAATTLDATYIGKAVIFGAAAAAFAVTLPALSSTISGATIWFYNSTPYPVTLNRAGTDLITQGSGSGNSIVLQSGDSLALTNYANTNWEPIGGTAAAAFSGTMAGANFTTAAQFDNSTKLATTAFVQRALGNMAGQSAITVNSTLNATHTGRLVLLNANNVVATLPAASSVAPGSVITLVSQGSGNSVARNGTDLLSFGVATVTSVSMGNNDSMQVQSDGGSSWVIVDGSVAIGMTPGFAASLNPNGYQKLPSGLIIQWGIGTSVANASGATINFPVQFPTVCAQVVVIDSGAAPFIYGTANFTTTGFTMFCQTGAGTFSAGVGRYIAIGY